MIKWVRFCAIWVNFQEKKGEDTIVHSLSRLLSLSETALHFATVPVSVQGRLQAYMQQALLPPPTHSIEGKGRAQRIRLVIWSCVKHLHTLW